MKRAIKLSVLTLFGAFALTSCYKEEGILLEDWTTETHSEDATPDYDIVFNTDQVNRLDIVITADDWEAMQNDLESITGSSSGPGGGGTFSDETPIYVPCEWHFNGLQWYHVGIRYKGNSSLNNAGGVEKLPFRIKFDYFEDDYPEIDDQTFYGFNDLSMSSNYDDKSLLRERLACDLFREAGVPAPKTAFYEVYVDYGDGPVYFGLYTMVEVVFDAMLANQFGSGEGNCYKPDGDGASWSTSGFTLDDFEKKTNEDVADWSDIQAMYDVLHSSQRTSNPTQWRSDLDALFDTDLFLKYLAVNTVLQNWDTYGLMTHNYYLYHDPSDDLIKWIPWDNNESFQEGKMGGSLALDFSDVNAEDWPIIGYIYADDTYRATYNTYVESFIGGPFEPTKMANDFSTQHDIIEASVELEEDPYTYLDNSSDFDNAITELNNHCSSRESDVETYLATQ